jgi:mannose-6-phosphate isomerase class I
MGVIKCRQMGVKLVRVVAPSHGAECEFELLEYAKLAVQFGRIRISTTEQQTHLHTGVVIGFVQDGSGYLRTEQGDLPIETGDVFVIPAGMPHVSLAKSDSQPLVELVIEINKMTDQQVAVGHSG